MEDILQLTIDKHVREMLELKDKANKLIGKKDYLLAGDVLREVHRMELRYLTLLYQQEQGEDPRGVVYN